MPDNSKIRMAVIGCGPIGKLHAQAISVAPRAVLVGVCDPDAERRDSLAQMSHASAYASFRELLDHQALDAVSIATPDHLHVDVTLAAIEAGCHVFCEKPLAMTVAEGRQMVEAAAARSVNLAVDFNRRFAFGYRTAHQLLNAERIGKLEYCLLRVSDRTPGAQVARAPHAMLTTLLAHHFDLLRWYGGEIRTLSATAGEADVGALMHSVTLSAKFVSGALGTIVGAYRQGQTRTAEWMELGGAKGAIVVEDVTRRVTLCAEDPDQLISMRPNHFIGGDPFYDSLIAHVLAFVDDLANGRAFAATGHDALASMKLAAAAVESLASGKTIEVET